MLYNNIITILMYFNYGHNNNNIIKGNSNSNITVPGYA